MPPTLEVDIRKRLGAFDLSVELAIEQELMVLFGHSGSGKSMTLRLVAGLASPDSGRIVHAGTTWFDSERGVNLPARARAAGYALQHPALFPHMTVAENVTFGMPRDPRRTERAGRLLEALGLSGFEGRKPSTLSGGQQQRVALARALGRRANLLLLDEPFSALDESLRAALRSELLRLREQLGLAIVFVTHDLREAHLLGDRLAVFDEGRVLQVGARDDVFRRPASRRVAELTGVSNIWRGEVAEITADQVVVRVEGVPFRASAPAGGLLPGESVDVMVRSERVNLRREMQPGDRANWLPARVVAEFAYGSAYVLHVVPEGAGPRMEVEIAARPYEVLDVAHRKVFTVEIEPADLHVVRATTSG